MINQSMQRQQLPLILPTNNLIQKESNINIRASNASFPNIISNENAKDPVTSGEPSIADGEKKDSAPEAQNIGDRVVKI